jgi:alpha/beta superfamily hydrolase
MKPFSLTLEKFTIQGAAGSLETVSSWPQKPQGKTVVVICHPHPLFSGTMNNKVVTTLYKTFDLLGCPTVRFNFRGVGKSEGKYGEVVGETEDLKAVLAWVKEALPDYTVWLAGFSFGGFIAANVTNQDSTIAQLVTIAPAVNHADFYKLTDIQCPWLIVHGESDEVVPFEESKTFADDSPVPVTFTNMPETSHFFHGKLVDLRQILLDSLER